MGQILSRGARFPRGRSGAQFWYNRPHSEAAFGTPQESSGRQGSSRLLTVPLRGAEIRSRPRVANLRAERRLGQVQTFGRPPEIEFFGDGNEIPCVTEFHSGNGNSYNLSL